MSELRVTEIFYSIQGESSLVGWPTVFVRLTGCPLRCGYCDTEYAFQGGEQLSIDNILQQVSQYNTPYVCVTGGEPLAQKNCPELLKALCEQGKFVSLETSGAIDISHVDPRVTIVMDIKTPGSGESDKNKLDNIDHLKPSDQLKFVLTDMADYDWAKDLIAQRNLDEYEVLLSPSWQQLSATELAERVLADQLNVRVQVQLHKILWGEAKGK